MSAPLPEIVPEKRHSMATRLAQIVALRKAGEMLGQTALATALGVADRTLRAYLGADRSISAEMLDRAATALEMQAFAMREHAERIRRIADEQAGLCRKSGT